MRDMPVAELESALEVSLLEQVLKDRGITYRIERYEWSFFDIYMGEGKNVFESYARAWGYAQDADAILQALAEVRASWPDDPAEWDIPLSGKRWRIKRVGKKS